MADLTRSPFPGMDPWMETHWGDVHGKLAAYAADALNLILPPALRATIEERIILEPETNLAYRPDVAIRKERAGTFTPFQTFTPGGGTATTLIGDPFVIRITSAATVADPMTERFIKIEDEQEKIVTTIEWISPTNKIDLLAMRQFQAKRRRVLGRGANAVEIDLTREGGPTARGRLLEPVEIPEPQQREYVAVVCRGTDPSQAEVYSLGLRDRLPAIRIPLRPTDADVPLDLQALVDATWRNGRYWQTDYARPLDPPLPAEDAAWAAERVAAWRGEPAAQ